mgnify:CR=1 FL=1
MRNRLDRFLAVGRRVTNILTLWPDDIGEALLKDRHDFRCIIDRQSSLRQKRKIVGIGRFNQARVIGSFNQCHRADWNLAKCADHFGMPFVAHKDDVTAGIHLPFGLLVDF